MVHERDISRHDKLLIDHDARINQVELNLARLGTKVGVYAALGAGVGGSLCAGVIALIFSLLQR
jgi:hypothetical protein